MHQSIGATGVIMADVCTYRLLLKYTSRDSVELLGRGKNGVHEARLAIAGYEEA